jgi:beta-lactamase class A
MSSASTIKTPIMLAVLDQVYQYRLRLDDKICVDNICEDTQVFDCGARRASILELLVWMITLSDNTSTNALIDLVGFDKINHYMSYELGLTQTVLRRKMLDFVSRQNGCDNLTTACDMYKIFRKLFCGEILDPELCGEAIWILKKQRNGKLFTRYIWEDVILAHKTGGLDYLSHDTGVFTLDGRQVFLGVLVQNAPDIDGDPKLIGRVARTVYDMFCG